MPNNVKSRSLPKVGECIAYVKSLGYHLSSRSEGMYVFVCNDQTKRPSHNWRMVWTLGEMRHAVKHGC